MKEKTKTILLDGAKGAGIGAAFIVPGISGGTIALMFGIYQKILGAVDSIFKHFLDSIKILLPILIGVVLAILALWFPLKYAFEYAMFAIVALFAGFIVGGLPGLFNMVKDKKFKFVYVIPLIIALAVSVLLGVLSVLYNLDLSTYFETFPIWLYFVLIPIGIIAAAALVVPGISGSMFLLVIGVYKPILNIFHTLRDGNWANIGPIIGVLGCLAIGVIIGFFTFAKLMKILLDKFPAGTMWGVIGFVVGSIVSIFYNNEIVTYYQTHGPATWEIVLGVVLLLVGMAGSYLLGWYGEKKKAEIETKDIPAE